MTVSAHGGNLALASRKYGLPPDSFLDFSANVNPLGPPRTALDAIRANLKRIGHYPDPDCTELREGLGRYLDVDPSNLVIGNGATELIHLLARIMKPACVLVAVPAFSEYARAAESCGASLALFPLAARQGFVPETSQLRESLSGIDMLFIANPNNPSGSLFGRDRFLGVVEAAGRTGTTVVVDEAFMDFVEEPGKFTLRQEAAARDNLVVLGSLTKFFALAGLRVGYAVGPASLAERLWRSKDPWSVNTLAQVAARASMGDADYAARTDLWVRSERAFMFRMLAKLPGVTVYPPSANYILADLRGSGLTASRIQERLGPMGILVRDCADYPGLDPYHVRFALRTREENRVLIAALEDMLTHNLSGPRPGPLKQG